MEPELAPAGRPAPRPRYLRRRPEETLLHRVVRDHWKTFLAESAQRDDGAPLPGFVTAEFERYLECGLLAHGFARVRCAGCGDELLVAFACKGRGFCPSCTTRRMQATATHLIDRVLPRVPVRQWVLSLPRRARFQLARDPRLITRVLALALRAVFADQRRRARRAGLRGARTGAITFVQRFGGALNLNVHFHSVVPDGVWVREAGALRFAALPAPADEDVARVLRKIARRVRKLLAPRFEAQAADARPPDLLAAAQAGSIQALRGPPPLPESAKRLAAYHEGFSLHAGVHLHANDRDGLAQLCGYGARPPLTQERLSAEPDGTLVYRLKRPLRDGNRLLRLQPLDLLRRLATLVPPPRHHLVRYHGVFAPHARWRAEVIPDPPPAPPAACASTTAAALEAPVAPAAARPAAGPPRSTWIPWAELLLRIFKEDVLACPCGGRRVVLAFIKERKLVRKILEHLGLPTTGPPVAPARSSSTAGEDAWQDDVPVLQQPLR